MLHNIGLVNPGLIEPNITLYLRLCLHLRLHYSYIYTCI